MKIGDFVIIDRNVNGEGAYSTINKIIDRGADYAQVVLISNKEKRNFNLQGRYQQISDNWCVNALALRKLTLEKASAILKTQHIRPEYKEELQEFLRKLLLAEFGEPPVKVEVPTEVSKLVLEEDLYQKPQVIEGQVSGFIRINNR